MLCSFYSGNSKQTDVFQTDLLMEELDAILISEKDLM